MRSLQQPKRIAFIGSDGRTYKFLCKANDDLRKDARMMEFNYMINDFLKKNPESRDRNLCIYKKKAPVDIILLIFSYRYQNLCCYPLG